MSELIVAWCVSLGVLVVIAPPASAHVVLPGYVMFPDVVAVGQTFTASLTLENSSTPPESTQYPVINPTKIDFMPACPLPEPAPGCQNIAEAGVFSLSPTGTGVGQASCAGTWTISEISPGTFRFVPPGGEATLQLATGESCLVRFTVSTLRLPDEFKTDAGVKTLQIVELVAAVPNGVTFPGVQVTFGDSTTVTNTGDPVTFVVEPSTFEPGDRLTVGATRLSPATAYRLRIHSKWQTCHLSPTVLGADVITDSNGRIAGVGRVLPTNMTSGVRYLCWVRPGDSANHSSPAAITVL